MKRISKLLIILIFIPLMASCFFGTLNLHEGIESFRAQDFRRAFVRLMPEAQKGQPDAQYAIGYMFYYGQGVVEDRKKAWFWISLAAKAGQPDAVKAIQILGAGHMVPAEG